MLGDKQIDGRISFNHFIVIVGIIDILMMPIILCVFNSFYVSSLSVSSDELCIDVAQYTSGLLVIHYSRTNKEKYAAFIVFATF